MAHHPARSLTPILIGLTLLTSGTATAQPLGLGRLFFTPEQRIALERENGDDASRQPLRIDGIVTRSSGEQTRWVNGQSEAQPRPLPARVGDTLHQTDGQRTPLLGTGQILTHPPRQ